MFVPTTDTTRNRIIIMTCLKHKIPVLAVGATGTGKTSLINGLLTELDEGSYIY
jgi:dynein heavy chain